ncbi:MAG: hypothetical protein M1526_06990 [Candidatus Thermoplasmatota archaeon]|jgi:hypothetical protein|nr:hypothetical protein [Candidatus Thermoplasmatota archaeon]MCL5680433.1 hypothetical protein [Candidatus Thermoplasmatota archaeon]
MFRVKGNHAYLLEMEEFNSMLLEDFVDSYGKTLLLLGDGVFVDAYALKKKFQDQLYVQRILNMYQMQKTLLEDLYEEDFSIFLVIRLSELKDWKEGVVLNISNAMEGLAKLSGKPNVFYLIQDEEYIPTALRSSFKRKIVEAPVTWEETPQVLEWK